MTETMAWLFRKAAIQIIHIRWYITKKIDESITEEADVLSIGIKTTGDLEKENKSVNQQDSNCFPVQGENMQFLSRWKKHI